MTSEASLRHKLQIIRVALVVNSLSTSELCICNGYSGHRQQSDQSHWRPPLHRQSQASHIAEQFARGEHERQTMEAVGAQAHRVIDGRVANQQCRQQPCSLDGFERRLQRQSGNVDDKIVIDNRLGVAYNHRMVQPHLVRSNSLSCTITVVGQ